MPRSEMIETKQSQDQYSLWNLKLLEAFFSPASKGDAVWLQVDPLELDSLGPELGGDEGFLKAVRMGPSWGSILRYDSFLKGSVEDLVARVLGLVDQRRHPRRRPKDYIDPETYTPTYLGQNAPTYLPMLAALVRSAAEAGSGYYPHLREALGLGAHWGSQQMESLEIAWLDLETWTEKTGGNFGLFRFRILGGYKHVGVPRAQSVMSRKDIEMIPRIFAQVGARPAQMLNEQLLGAMRSCAVNACFLSATFKSALPRPEFQPLVDARLKALFDEWDGKIPSLPGLYRGEGVAEDRDAQRVEIEVCLSPQADDSLPWNIQWRLPPMLDSGEFVLSRNGVRWIAAARGTEYASTQVDMAPAAQAEAMHILELSSDGPIKLDVSARLELGDESSLGEVFLPRAILRVFTWDYDKYTSSYQLRERGLPQHGAAYLLGIGANAKLLSNWLERESIRHSQVDTAGLPPGSMLVSIDECSSLTDEQRNSLPDGQNERQQYRALRLAGGRFVSRAGIRQYMAYDLPTVELDAPPRTIVEAQGIELEAEDLDLDNSHPIPVRRFKASHGTYASGSYLIVAKLHGKELGRVTLRIAPDSGEQVMAGNSFSLDEQGNPKRDHSGLCGTLANPNASFPKIVQPSPGFLRADMGNPLEAKDVSAMLSGAAAQFLDSLAQFGSMAYGPAREQLARLLARDGNQTAPAIVLLDLRARGHLEIETNAKGHMTRIYASAPVLYQLPGTFKGQPIYGVLGTLRIQHWKSLAALVDGCAVYSSGANKGLLCAWRLVPRDCHFIDRQSGGIGFEVHDSPALAIAGWAASVEDVRARIEQLAGESLGKGGRVIEKLSSGSGRFCKFDEVVFDRPGPACQLFRLEDRETTGLRVYSLGIYRGGSGVRYGFTRDSRWGVWIALVAFAHFVKEQWGIGDACPWPIPYLLHDGTVLLPARISLPAVLERALILCSGNGPETLDLAAGDSAGLSHLPLARIIDGREVAKVSPVYDGMAKGKWLAYKYVPEEVARQVALKLGGVLMLS